MIPASFPPKHMARIFEIRHGDGGKPLAWWKVHAIAKSEGMPHGIDRIQKWYRMAVVYGFDLWNIDPNPITPREIEVIRCAANDMPDQGPEWYKIKRKLQVRTKAAAVAKAIREGYID
ncbi:helix-turn-helix transcriptional regulator [Zhongshania sp.]|uniref:helix-turn-helix transcriptional regulator n=1 Tax=Zhongshania sp. TaxID=1971902 RepID=UPI003569D9D1